MTASPLSRKTTTPRARLAGRTLVGFRATSAHRGATRGGAVKEGIAKGVSLAGITKPVLQ